MPTLAQINDADTTLTDAAKAHAASLIRSSSRYQAAPALYTDISDRLDDASTVQAQQINAAIVQIDALDQLATVRLKGGDDAVDFDAARDREQLVDYVIDVLFDSVAQTSSSVAVGRITGSTGVCRRCGCPITRFAGGCAC